MSVDRGGLNYPINVSYDGSAVDDFRVDIARAKKDWSDLKASLASSKASATLPAVPPITAPASVAGTTGKGSVAGSAGEMKQLADQTQRASSFADTLSKSFERLFLRVLIVGTIYKVAGEMSAFVGEMISFNSEMEKATLGISSLLLALGDIKDAAGNDVNAFRGFELAQAEATKQVAQLRVDALATAATFEQLAKVFETSLAPGLQAGLNLDQIRAFSVGVTQAASALNVPLTAIGAQIRAILTGSINNRNTTLARSLGITNEDIKLAKEAGTLVEFLQQKLQAFSTAGDAAKDTWAVILTNTKDAIQQIIGEGGLSFFIQLKGLFKDIQNSLVSISPLTGNLVPNPKAVAVVQDIANALSLGLVRARALADEFVYGDLINAAKLFGQALGLAFDVLTGFIQGGVRGIKDLSAVFDILVFTVQELSSLFTKFTGIDIFKNSTLQSSVALFIEIATVVAGIKLSVSVIVGLWSLLASPLVGTIALLAVIAELTRQWESNVTGVNLKYTTLAELLTTQLVFGMGKFISTTILGFEILLSSLNVIVAKVVDVMQTSVDALLPIALTGLSAILKVIQDKLPEALKVKAIDDFIRATSTAADKIAKEDDEQHKRRLDHIKEEQQAILEKTNKEKAAQKLADDIRDAAVKKVLAGNDANPDLLALISKSLTAARSAIGLGGDAFGLGEVDASAKSITKTFEDMPGIISSSLESFKAQTKIMNDLKLAADKENDALREGLATLGLTGPVLSERKNQFDAENKTVELTKQHVLDRTNIEESLTGTLAQRLDIEDKIEALGKVSQDISTDINEKAKAYLIYQNLLKGSELDKKNIYTELAAARQKGDRDEIAALNEKLALNVEYHAALEEQITQVKQQATASLIGGGLSPDDAKKVVDLAIQKVQLSGHEKVFKETIKQIDEDILEIERKNNEIAANKNTLLAQQATLELKNANAILAVQNANASALFKTTSLGGPPALPEVTNVVQAQNAVRLLQAQSELAQRIREIALAQLATQIEINKAELISLEISMAKETNAEKLRVMSEQFAILARSNNALSAQYGVQQQQNNLLIEKANQDMAQLKETAQHTLNIINKPISTGIIDGIRKAAQELPSLYQGTVDTIKSIVTGLTDFISTSIVNAFDPTKKQDLTQRFATFLQGIAKQVLDMFIHLAIVKAVLGLGFLGDGGIAGGGLPALGGLFSSGGSVGATTPTIGLPGLPFATGGMIPGYANGGGIDNIHIRATAGEFMQPISAVQRYGQDFMQRLQRGLADPYSLRAAAGMGQLSGRSSPSGGAAQTSLVGHREAQAQTQRTPSTTQGAPHQSYIVASPQALDTLLAGGKSAMFNFFSANKGRIRGLINS